MNEAWIIAFVEEHSSLLLIASRARYTLLVYIVSKAKHAIQQNKTSARRRRFLPSPKVCMVTSRWMVGQHKALET